MYNLSANYNTNPQKGQVDVMDDGQKKIWICLLIVILAAVVIGILYYFSAPTEHSSEGFLIRAEYGQCEMLLDTASEEACSGVILLSEEGNNGI